MPNPYIHPRDTEIVWVPPTGDEERVPTAEEMKETSRLLQRNNIKTAAAVKPTGLTARPHFTANASTRSVDVGNIHFFAPGHSISDLSVPKINLVPLPDTHSSVSRYDNFYLAVASVEITADIDPNINFEFKWRDQANTLITLERENTRRYRSVWFIASSPTTISGSYLLSQLPGSEGKPSIVPTNSEPIVYGTITIHPEKDSLLTAAKTYRILEESFTLIPLFRVWRVQNYVQNGYHWGRDGEAATLETDYHVQPIYRYVGVGYDSWEARAGETFRRVMLGLPITGGRTYDRWVQNFVNGQVSSNLDAPGQATPSPNGSTALANNQRVIFTNEGRVQKLGAIAVVTSNSGGMAIASVPFQVNSPLNSRFSGVVADHKVYRADGADISSDGTFTGLGSSGALTWTATANAGVSPGSTVYVVPGIQYPAGSGFSIAGRVEKIFVTVSGSLVEIASENIREASQSDLGAYQEPVAGQNFIVVADKSRAGIQYIYRKFTVSANAQGVLVLPSGANGIIAFISGTGAPSGRINKPVVAGLTPSAQYSVLCYHSPLSSEQWQFQLKYATYPGLKNAGILNGATVKANPIGFAHSLGGATSVLQAEGDVQFEPIAMRCPSNSAIDALKPHHLNTYIRFANEPDLGEQSFRQIIPISASGHTALRAGAYLQVEPGGGGQSQSLSGKLLSDTSEVGYFLPNLESNSHYQLVVYCPVLKDRESYLFIATFTGFGNIKLDSDNPYYTAFDVFNLF
ncbi:MAG: hypothetical protein LRZ84_14520 [Desertifilum sp.]|nr:hypothetical protein [Desertifilum sp.]